MHIFHIAEKTRWEASRLAGSYARSTLDRSLEDEGFIHASRADQWRDVRERHYDRYDGALVLLTIDTDLLTSPWREEPVGDTTYPHIHGPLNPSAVVAVEDLPRPDGAGPQPTFASVFIGEMAFRMLAAVAVMLVAVVAGFLAATLFGDDFALLGLLAGLGLGVAASVVVARRRDARRA